MSLQYCKIGKVKPALFDSVHLNQLEKRHSIVIEQAQNLKKTDVKMSDVLYNEAKRLKKYISNLQQVLTKKLDSI